MKTKLLLAWRILVAAGMVAIILIAGLIVYEFSKDKIMDRNGFVYTKDNCYSDSYVYEYKKRKIRLKDSKTGEYLTPELSWIFEGRARDTLTVFFQDGKRGFLNVYTGKIAVPAQYEHAWVFSGGLGAVVKDGQLGFIGHDGETVIPFSTMYDSRLGNKVDFVFKDGYCTFYDATGKHGLIDKSGAWAVKPQYDYINNPLKGIRIVKDKGKFGLLDSTLQLVQAVEYDWIDLLESGIIVRKDNDQKLLAYDGKTVLQPFVYDSVTELHYNSGKTNDEGKDVYVLSDYKSFSVGEKHGLMNKSGKIVVPAIYGDIDAIGNDLFTCRVAGGSYYITIDGSGKVIQ